MFRSYLKEGKDLTTIDACAFMILASEQLTPDIIQESFDRLDLEEIWENCNQYDLPIMIYVQATKPNLIYFLLIKMENRLCIV